MLVNPRKLGVEQELSRDIPKQQLHGKGHTQEGLGYSFIFGIRFPTARNETSPWLCFCQGRVKSPEVSVEKDGVGICSQLWSCPALCEVELKVEQKWKPKGSVQPRGPHNLDFFPFPNGPLEQDPQAQSCPAVPQPWVEHQPFLPPCPELALLYPSHAPVPRDEVPRSRFQPAFSSSHLLLSREKSGCGHTETRTQHTRGRCRSALQGVTTFIFLGIWREGSNQCSGTVFGRSTLAPSYQSL